MYGESLVFCQLMLPWQFISPILAPTVNFQPITYTVSEGEKVPPLQGQLSYGQCPPLWLESHSRFTLRVGM